MALCVFLLWRVWNRGLLSLPWGDMSGTGVSGMEDIGIKMKKKKKGYIIDDSLTTT